MTDSVHTTPSQPSPGRSLEVQSLLSRGGASFLLPWPWRQFPASSQDCWSICPWVRGGRGLIGSVTSQRDTSGDVWIPQELRVGTNLQPSPVGLGENLLPLVKA